MNNKEINNINKRKMINKIFKTVFLICTLFGIFMLIILMYQILKTGLSSLSFKFITSLPSRFPHKAGIKTAFVGSAWVIGVTALISFPVGVGTAIYLEEYANKNKFNEILQINIANLAGVPSIVYGILGLGVFVKFFNIGRGILTGALTLSLLILPVIIISSQEAIRGVPNSLREGSLALGVSKWQTITGVVLPYSMPGILTGVILAISRALGEAAPLIMVGALGYVAFLPDGLMSAYTTLPIQIFNWTSRPQPEFQNIASAGIIVLMTVLLSANAVAILLRNKYQKRLD